MARVTVEDCLELVDNRFALVILAAERARQIAKGAPSLIRCDNKPAVTALREIAAGKVRFQEVVKETLTEFLQEDKTRLRRTRRHSHGQMSPNAPGNNNQNP